MTWSKPILHHVNLIFSSGSDSIDTSTAAQAQSDELTPNTSEIGFVAKDRTK